MTAPVHFYEFYNLITFINSIDNLDELIIKLNFFGKYLLVLLKKTSRCILPFNFSINLFILLKITSIKLRIGKISSQRARCEKFNSRRAFRFHLIPKKYSTV